MVWILYETGMTVSATGFRLNLKEVSMSDNVDNRCLQFVAAPVQICGFFLAPTGALIVMMVYYTYTVQLFEFSLSPLMQLMLQVSL